MAVMPKISMVGTPEDMALTIHEYLGSGVCYHDDLSAFKMCEGLAETLCDYENGVVKSGTDFLESLKTNDLALTALKKQLAFVWDQGWVSGKADGKIDDNPYGE